MFTRVCGFNDVLKSFVAAFHTFSFFNMMVFAGFGQYLKSIVPWPLGNPTISFELHDLVVGVELIIACE